MHQKITLDNGVRVILVPKTGTKIVAVLVMVKCGTDYESKEIKGIYHFIEHLPFKGTAKRPIPERVSGAIEEKGGQLNAFTDAETMGFAAKISSNHLELALDVLSDMLISPLLEPREINREIRVVIEEINTQKDNPQEYLEQVLWNEVAYGDQPAGWSTLGTKEIVRAFNREKVLRYFKRHFKAEGVVVVMVGNYDRKEAKRLVKKYFSGIKRGRGPKKNKLKEFQKKPQLVVSCKRTEQTHFSLGVKAIDFNLLSPERHALVILATTLGGNTSSRIFISLRERMGAAYDVSTEAIFNTDRSCLVTNTGVDTDKTEEAIRLILSEYQRIVNEKVTPEELEAKKEYLKGTTIMHLEGLMELGYFYGIQELLLDRIITPEKEIEDCLKVTPEEIQKVAQSIFQPKNLNLALIGPFRSKKRFKEILNSYD